MRGPIWKPTSSASSVLAVEAGDLEQRAQPGVLRALERVQAEAREDAVLVDQRHDVADRRDRDVGHRVDRGTRAGRSRDAPRRR